MVCGKKTDSRLKISDVNAGIEFTIYEVVPSCEKT